MADTDDTQDVTNTTTNISTIPVASTAPYLVTSSGTTGTWTNSKWTNTLFDTDGSSVSISGTLSVSGDISAKGESILSRIERIEQMVNIPTRNIDLENRYPRLKEIWEMYNRELEKYTNWEKLKEK